MAVYEYIFNGLDCAHCAKKLETKIRQIPGIKNAEVKYPSCRCTIEAENQNFEEELKTLVSQEEPDVVIEHVHEHHHHEHEEKAEYVFEITGIDCPHCAAKLRDKIAELDGISDVVLSYEESRLSYVCDHDEAKEKEKLVRKLVTKEEPEAVMTFKTHHHMHDACDDHCACEHDHHHEQEEKKIITTANTRRYRITGIDCADCAAKLEHKLTSIEGISNVNISFIHSQLLYDCAAEDLERIEKEVETIKAAEEPEAVIEPIRDTKTYKFSIRNIDCADCADKLARKTERIEGVVSAEADFMNALIRVECMPADVSLIEEQMRVMIHEEEPEVEFSRITENTPSVKEEEDEDDRTMVIRLVIGAVLFVISLIVQGMPAVISALCAWTVLGYDVLLKAVRGIGRGQVFDEHFLMAVATIAAIYLKDYKEAAGVMLFYQIGEYFQDLAVRRSRRSIGELMDIRPDTARVLRNGVFETADPAEVRTGESVQVKPGERIPLDGTVIEGSSSLDTSSLTGESKLLDVEAGDEVISGSVNTTGVILIRVTKPYAASTVSSMLELVENSESNKASQEKFITKFSRWYTPIVVFAAIAVAVITGIVLKDINEGIYRACTFLVISCPCALVISVPLSFFAGIGGLSGHGVLVKGANVIETLANTKQVVLDKTGTLTSGTFAISEIRGSSDEEKLIRYAAYAEYHSAHPAADGIRQAYHGTVDPSLIENPQEIPGRGVSAVIEGNRILAGNYKLMKENSIACAEETVPGTLVYVSCNQEYMGCLVLRDRLKENAAEAVRQIQASGITCAIVSGDQKDITEETARQLGIEKYYAECLPQDKVETVRKLKETGTTAFVGDGINDAPVLVTADAGFAMGALGSDAAIEAADVVIMDDSPARIALALKSAKRILRVANQNIYGAISIKILTLILGAFGIANMWMAIFADTGVALLCVLNSLRLLKISE